MLRPDIVDHQTGRRSVHEVKPDNNRAIAKGVKQVGIYIGVLKIRYPSRTYVPGTWQPESPYYQIIGLPGIFGLQPIRITVRNAGGGVIAYRIDEESYRNALRFLKLDASVKSIYPQKIS